MNATDTLCLAHDVQRIAMNKMTQILHAFIEARFRLGPVRTDTQVVSQRANPSQIPVLPIAIRIGRETTKKRPPLMFSAFEAPGTDEAQKHN
jgi:hypothetical protein